MNRFNERVALVSGGAAGIGGAVVKRLLDEGARVIVWDVDRGRLDVTASRYGEQVLCRAVDVSVIDEVEGAMAEAIQHFRRLDIVVNAAGIVGINAPFWETAPEQWDRVLQVNLTSAFLVARAATPHLLANQWGRIVNVASIAANEGPKSLAAYSASKAGLVGLTKSMGKDLAGTGVLVNAVAPALIATELLSRLTPEYLSASLSRIPLGRPGTLDEVAALVAWVCSEECSFSTGAVFDLSGGRGV